MSGETDSQGGNDGSPAASRPWTPAAAMEPVLPLAPPPARPGAGTPVAPVPRSADRRGGLLTVASVVVVAVVVAIVVVLAVLAGR